METEVVIIEFYDREQAMTTKLYVVKLGENMFRATKNETFGMVYPGDRI